MSGSDQLRRNNQSLLTSTPTAFRQSSSFLDEKKALACIHCGLCLGACPTYLETGNENDSPRGRIYIMRALDNGSLPFVRETVRHIDLCLGCRACEPACPSGVQYGALVEATREQIERIYRRPLRDRLLRHLLIERIFPFPRRFAALLKPGQWLRRNGLTFLLPAFLREGLDLLPQESTTTFLPEVSPAPVHNPRRVGLVEGCVMPVLFGRTNRATADLLLEVGCQVITPKSQVCCGALYAHNGNLERARDCARRNIAAFEPFELDRIIINAAGCGSTLKEYGHLLEQDQAWAARAAAFSAKVQDLSEYLWAHPNFLTRLRERSRAQATATCHDACHLAHAQRITVPPRDLVKAVAGAGFRELPESDLCCGSAGSYNLTEPAMAGELQKRKVRNIIDSGAECVVTTNPGCILQIDAGLRQAGQGRIKVWHLADYLRMHLNRLTVW